MRWIFVTYLVFIIHSICLASNDSRRNIQKDLQILEEKNHLNDDIHSNNLNEFESENNSHNHNHDHDFSHDHIDEQHQSKCEKIFTNQQNQTNIDRNCFLKALFDKYGEDGNMSVEGLAHLLAKLGLQNKIADHTLDDHKKDGKFVDMHIHHFSNSETDVTDRKFEELTTESVNKNLTMIYSHHYESNNNGCISTSTVLQSVFINLNSISEESFKELCPIIVYKLEQGSCDHSHHEMQQNYSKHTERTKFSLLELWLYGAGAVIFISLVGLMAILLIPLIQNYHGDVIQLLVGLAIGTLTSDSLLHLLPHAFTDHMHSFNNQHSLHHDIPKDEEQHTRGVIYGLMALMGIIGFLIFERVLTIISDLCSKNNRKTAKIANCNRSVGEKLSKHKRSEINHELEKLNEPKKHNDEKTEKEASHVKGPTNDIQLTTEQCHRETIVFQHPDPDKGFVVQLTDHHHHHQRQHQKRAKSVIMTIVTGDGMHNFFDGLAIGVAFVGSGLGGGLSTSVAILCHELPHEVGDFAVLLNAGLSTKRAIMYNTLSAILCFIGMTVGVIVGKIDTGLLSAIIAGMFLYIALVNMIPQLDCCPTQSGTTRAFKLSVQLIGISIGVSIMCCISIYEANLQSWLK